MSVVASQTPEANCLFDSLFRLTIKKTFKLHITALCDGNPPATDSSHNGWLMRKAFSCHDVNPAYGQEHVIVGPTFCASNANAMIKTVFPWWRHGSLFRVTGPLWGKSTDDLQKQVTRSFDIFFDLRLNRQLSKHSRRRWFETTSRSLWRHCNVFFLFLLIRPLQLFAHATTAHLSYHVKNVVAIAPLKLWSAQNKFTIAFDIVEILTRIGTCGAFY